jgi:hypothetical protein
MGLLGMGRRTCSSRAYDEDSLPALPTIAILFHRLGHVEARVFLLLLFVGVEQGLVVAGGHGSSIAGVFPSHARHRKSNRKGNERYT